MYVQCVCISVCMHTCIVWSPLLPVVVIDEAHNLIDAITNMYSVTVNYAQVRHVPPHFTFLSSLFPPPSPPFSSLLLPPLSFLFLFFFIILLCFLRQAHWIVLFCFRWLQRIHNFYNIKNVINTGRFRLQLFPLSATRTHTYIHAHWLFL